jgi:predicted  nucleic acid-binding Zn ribbon protein
MNPYTTNYGTVIAPGILRAVKADILGGVDHQKTLNDYLRDPIPQHEEDLDEANEVYNHVESIIGEEEADAFLEGNYIECPACDGDAYLLGALGRVKHYRCRNCGIDSSKS